MVDDVTETAVRVAVMTRAAAFQTRCSCSVDADLGVYNWRRAAQDSPSSKLLFAKDLPRYRQLVSQFYAAVQQMPPLTDDQLTRYMNHLSTVRPTLSLLHHYRAAEYCDESVCLSTLVTQLRFIIRLP